MQCLIICYYNVYVFRIAYLLTVFIRQCGYLLLLWCFGTFSGHGLPNLLPPPYFSKASVEVSRQIQLLQGGVVNPTPNPQPGGPGYPFLSGSSPLTCPEWEPLPVAMLPPA
jgi:hypothetical protein